MAADPSSVSLMCRHQGLSKAPVPSQILHSYLTCLFSWTPRHDCPLIPSSSRWQRCKPIARGGGSGGSVRSVAVLAVASGLTFKEISQINNFLVQISYYRFVDQRNLLIRLAVPWGPCGIAAQTLPALCYTTHKVGVKESEGGRLKMARPHLHRTAK